MIPIIRIPFQFKIYLLIFVLFTILLQLTTTRINRIITDQTLEKETFRFEEMKELFNNLIQAKTQTLINEARLVAQQDHIREALEMLNQGELIESYLTPVTPKQHPRRFTIFTDRNGQVIDGAIVISDLGQETEIYDRSELQSYADIIPNREKLLTSDSPITTYILAEQKSSNDEYKILMQLFATASVPVWDSAYGDEVVGTVTLGFPIDHKFAEQLLSGSSYQIGFISGDRIITSTLQPRKAEQFRTLWDRALQPKRQQLLIKPQTYLLKNEQYLVYASYLPAQQSERRGLYVMYMSLDETLRSIYHIKQSIIWVSLVILCFMLLVGYILARGVTSPVRRLADAVSTMAEGNYAIHVPVHSGDELETLSHEIHSLAQQLREREAEAKEYVEEIEQLNRDLDAKVQARTKDLEERNFRLRTISKELGQAYALIDDELKIVGELQKRLLPEPTVDFDGLSIRSFYHPNGRSGGDYYDFINNGPRHIYCLIADVSGHGTPAAFIMGTTRAIVHSLIERLPSTSRVLSTLNQNLMRVMRRGEFVTMFLGKFDIERQTLTYSIAGHTPPLLYQSEGHHVLPLKVEKGLPLGILDDPEFEEVTVKVQPGDRLLMYTDGIIEAFNEEKVAFGDERLGEVFLQHIEEPPENLLSHLMDELQHFVQRPIDVEPLEDDVTLVIVDYKSARIPAMSASEPESQQQA